MGSKGAHTLEQPRIQGTASESREKSNRADTQVITDVITVRYSGMARKCNVWLSGACTACGVGTVTILSTVGGGVKERECMYLCLSVFLVLIDSLALRLSANHVILCSVIFLRKILK